MWNCLCRGRVWSGKKSHGDEGDTPGGCHGYGGGGRPSVELGTSSPAVISFPSKHDDVFACHQRILCCLTNPIRESI